MHLGPAAVGHEDPSVDKCVKKMLFSFTLIVLLYNIALMRIFDETGADTFLFATSSNTNKIFNQADETTRQKKHLTPLGPCPRHTPKLFQPHTFLQIHCLTFPMQLEHGNGLFNNFEKIQRIE